jgi:hypothetical protein
MKKGSNSSNAHLKKRKKAGGVTVTKKAPPAPLKKTPSGKAIMNSGERTERFSSIMMYSTQT